MLGLLLLLLGRCRLGSIVSCLCRRDGIIALGLFLFINGCFIYLFMEAWAGFRFEVEHVIYLHCRNKRTSTPVNDAIDFDRSF